MNEIRILWIEEETNDALHTRKTCLATSNDFDTKIVESYSEALKLLVNLDEYDILLIDIRIKKGNCSEEIESELPKSPHYDSFGLDLIRKINILGHSHKIKIYTNETWDDIQTEVEGIVDKRNYLQKFECRNDNMFEHFISSRAIR